MSLEHAREARELAPDQRLAAGQPHVVDAHGREQADHAGDLLEGQDLRALEPRQPVGGHAVLAAEVAAVGDRHPQIADQTAVSVAQWLERHG